jgi:hypothetical protein
VVEFAGWFANNDGEWIKEKNEYGWTPLHLGMQRKASAAVLQLLMKAWPAGVKAKDTFGNTPLLLGSGTRHQLRRSNCCSMHGKRVSRQGLERPDSIVKEKERLYRYTPLQLGMKHKAKPLLLEVLLRHPSQPLWGSILKQGRFCMNGTGLGKVCSSLHRNTNQQH